MFRLYFAFIITASLLLPAFASAVPFKDLEFGVSTETNADFSTTPQFKQGLQARVTRTIVDWDVGLPTTDPDGTKEQSRLVKFCQETYATSDAAGRPMIAFNPATRPAATVSKVPAATPEGINQFKVSLSNIIAACSYKKDGIYKTPDIEVWNEPDLTAQGQYINIVEMWVAADKVMKAQGGGGKVSPFGLALSGDDDLYKLPGSSRYHHPVWYDWAKNFMLTARGTKYNPEGIRPEAISLHPYNDVNGFSKRVSSLMKNLFRNPIMYPAGGDRSQFPSLWLSEVSVYHGRQRNCRTKSFDETLNKPVGTDSMRRTVSKNKIMWVNPSAFDLVNNGQSQTAKPFQFACWLTLAKNARPEKRVELDDRGYAVRKDGKTVRKYGLVAREQYIFAPTDTTGLVQSRDINGKTYKTFQVSEKARAEHFVSLVNNDWKNFDITRIYWYDWANGQCSRKPASEETPARKPGAVQDADSKVLGDDSPTYGPESSRNGGCGDNHEFSWHSGLFDVSLADPTASWRVVSGARQ